MQKITSRENAMVKRYLKLAGSKSARDKAGLFTVEGAKICLEAFSSGIEIDAAFITEELYEKDETIKAAADGRDNVFLITESVADKLCDTKTPQGIFCICKKLDKDFDVDTINNGKLFIMLCGVRDPGNIGTIIRTADGLGADGVILTRDCCDIYSPKTVRSTMGSLIRMKIKTVDDPCEFLTSLPDNINTVASVLSDDSVCPQKINKSGGAVVLAIGNEANGLNEKTIAACRQKTMIPMNGGAESFNAAVAAAILMWEIVK